LNSSLYPLEDLQRRATVHGRPVVAPAPIVALEEVSQDRLQIRQPIEAATVEGRAVALVKGRLVEALDDGVEVRERGGVRWWEISSSVIASWKACQ
jgi:hypothetical protein